MDAMLAVAFDSLEDLEVVAAAAAAEVEELSDFPPEPSELVPVAVTEVEAGELLLLLDDVVTGVVELGV